MMAGGGVMAVQMVNAGTGRRRQARKEAMADTVTWLRTSGASKKGFPTLPEAYRYYEARLGQGSSKGTLPVTMRQFTKDLSLHDLRSP